MSESFRYWLDTNLKKRRWSQRKLARQTGFSQSFISRLLSGETTTTADFCIKVAEAWGEPPASLLRLADLLPPAGLSPAPEGEENPPQLSEVAELFRQLPPAKQGEALRYLRFLHHDKD